MVSISAWNYLICYGERANFEDVLIEISQQGHGLEIWLNWTADQSVFRRENWEHIKNLTSGIPRISVHSGYTKHYSREGLLKELDFCQFIGADPIVCHPLSLGLQTGTWDFHSGLELTKEDYDRIGAILTEAADRSLHIALENGPLDILVQVLDAMEVHPASDSLGICIDTGHANMHQDVQQSPVTAMLNTLKHKLIHLHLHDNGGVLDDHQVPGNGTTNWEDVFSVLKSCDYKGDIVLELKTNNPGKAAEESIDFIRKYYPIPLETH